MKLFVITVCLFFLFTYSFAQKAPAVYPVTISFGSKCCGVPDSKPVFDMMQAFKKKYHIKKIGYDKTGPLGREGEYQLAFTLNGFTKKQQAAFIYQIKNTVTHITDAAKDNTSAGYVNIEENVLKTNNTANGRVKVMSMIF